MRGWKDAGLPTVSAPPPPQSRRGAILYITQCATCHQSDGMGLPGHFPPLNGDAAVLNPDPTAMTSIVLSGAKGGKIGGKTWLGTMPPFGVTLKDDEIAAIETYVRQNWHNHAPAVGVTEVSRIHAAMRGKQGAAGGGGPTHAP